MYPLVGASSSQVWFYVMSAWHLVSSLGQAALQLDVPSPVEASVVAKTMVLYLGLVDLSNFPERMEPKSTWAKIEILPPGRGI